MLKQTLQDRRTNLRKRFALFCGIAVFLLALLLYFLSQTEPVQKRYIYPYPHQALVELYATANGVDSALVASVIMHESKFHVDAKSDRGAIGLMQVMPETATWIATELGEKEFTTEKLREPETNIRYGVWYLAELEREFAGNEVLALAAYNAGRGIVHDWMEEYDWTWTFHNIEEIPYPETRHYVRKVMHDRARYEKLYAVPPKGDRDEKGILAKVRDTKGRNDRR